MKSFGQWFRDAGKSVGIEDIKSSETIETEAAIIERCDPEVALYNSDENGEYSPTSTWEYPCRSCGKLISIGDFCDVEEFEADYAYCGGSPHCIP